VVALTRMLDTRSGAGRQQQAWLWEVRPWRRAVPEGRMERGRVAIRVEMGVAGVLTAGKHGEAAWRGMAMAGLDGGGRADSERRGCGGWAGWLVEGAGQARCECMEGCGKRMRGRWMGLGTDRAGQALGWEEGARGARGAGWL